jgi:hypothetical protein
LAVVEVGISPVEFWSLSWYDWGLYLLRLEKRIEKDRALWEEDWDRTRHIMTAVINSQGGKLTPQSLMELPKDKEEKKVLLKPEEVEKLFPKQLKSGK